jgi:hypothetical protein
MIISRVWAMPNKNTFEIKPIKELIEKYFKKEYMSIDPFANNKKYATITNDMNKEFDTTYNMDAGDFLKIMKDDSIDFVFYDPPYSVRQVSECYKKFGYEVTQETTRSDWWTLHKKEISRIVKRDGIVLSCGWNSGGIGKTNGFEIIEILLIPHGGIHNDTIVVIEKKM